jgi:hypothetical protein
MKFFKKIILYVSITILAFSSGYFVSNYSISNSQVNNQQQQQAIQQSDKNNGYFKISYFDDFKGVWGDATSSGKTKWQAIDSQYNQRSMPGIVKHIPYLQKESIKLSPVARTQITKDYFHPELIDKSYKEYGNLIGGYFASQGQIVIAVKKFDVDLDDVSEDIIETEYLDSQHPPSEGYIVKNDRIILSTGLQSGSIEPAKNGNGFYLKNSIRDDDQPLCCPSGYRLYRIVYEKGFFRPVWEQEVKYVRVGD